MYFLLDPMQAPPVQQIAGNPNDTAQALPPSIPAQLAVPPSSASTTSQSQAPPPHLSQPAPSQLPPQAPVQVATSQAAPNSNPSTGNNSANNVTA